MFWMRLAVESQKRDNFSSFIVSVPQPTSYSFACHVSCKVKYYWKVANVKVRFPETVFFHFRSFVVPWAPLTSYQLWIIVDHEHNRWNLVTRRQIDRFHCHATKRINWKPSSGRRQENEMAQSFWVICRNVSRTFVDLCMETPYWYSVLGHQYGRRKSTKHLKFAFSIKALSFHSRTSMCT